MRKTIEELKYNNEVCEIYTNSEMTNKFSVGYIIENDKDFFVCRAIDQYGAQDGWFCCLYDNIIRIQKETVYLKNLMQLEIVEKVFSVDTEGRDNTKKGIYQIRHPYVHFYYTFFLLLHVLLPSLSEDKRSFV